MGLLNVHTALMFFPLLKLSIDRAQRLAGGDVALRSGSTATWIRGFWFHFVSAQTSRPLNLVVPLGTPAGCFHGDSQETAQESMAGSPCKRVPLPNISHDATLSRPTLDNPDDISLPAEIFCPLDQDRVT